jgi:hypothetical protein
MKNVMSLMALGIMFAGSVLADNSSMEQQKNAIQMQNDMQKRGANGELSPQSSMPVPPPAPEVAPVQDRRDLVGMPLDDNKGGSGIGGDHIVEMNDSERPILHDNLGNDNAPMTVDGTATDY